MMVYNMVQSWGMITGDSVVIPEPNLLLHWSEHKGKGYSFSRVHVETPLLLVVNGKLQSSSSQAASTVVSWPWCEWPYLTCMIKREWRPRDELDWPHPVTHPEWGAVLDDDLSILCPESRSVSFLSLLLTGSTSLWGHLFLCFSLLFYVLGKGWNWSKCWDLQWNRVPNVPVLVSFTEPHLSIYY